MLGAAIAAMQGRPWKPYQRFMADVAGELNPDGTYRYPVVAVQLPRQSGKTTTAYDVALGRGRAYRDYRVRYSTHKGTITSDRFADWFLELERNPAMLRLMKLRRSRGTEAVVWRRQGSYWQAFPARDGALRSAALDMVVNDEAQEHDALTGAALTRTVTPTFTTRTRRQLWVVFTAGTDASVYAAQYLRRGIAGDPGVALFDYGCPEHVDPLDQDAWSSWHPGLAYGLTTPAALRMALAEGEAAFIREYAGIWTRLAAPDTIPTALWLAAQTAVDMPAGAPVTFGVDVAADRAATTIVAGTRAGDLELVDRRPGVDWAPGRLAALAGRWRSAVAVGSRGSTGVLADQLRLTGAFQVGDDPLTVGRPPLLLMTDQDTANATGTLLDDLTAGVLRVRPHPDLDDAVAAAATRPVGDGGIAFSVRGSAGPIDALRALAAARWGALHAPVPVGRPVIAGG
jgi:hypothetical protein